MRGHVKTKKIFVAKIGTKRKGFCQNTAYKLAFVTPVINDEGEAIKLGVEGWFKFLTRPGFVADENSYMAGSQNYVYDIKEFENLWPTKKERISLKELKRLEQRLNNEQ